jgi:hypothetical protein
MGCVLWDCCRAYDGKTFFAKHDFLARRFGRAHPAAKRSQFTSLLPLKSVVELLSVVAQDATQ